MVEMCGNPKLTQALQYLKWYETNIIHNQNVRMATLEETIQFLSMAKALAFSCSLLFLFCISILAAAITIRLINNKNMAMFLGMVYFAFFSFVLTASRDPMEFVIDNFRIEANTVHNYLSAADVNGPDSLKEVINTVSSEQARVPQLFHEMSSYIPAEGRWWTLGWDDVSLIRFQNEAFQALIRKGNLGLRTIETIRIDLEKKCRESGLQI